VIVCDLGYRRELDALAIHPALEKAILKFRDLRQALRHPERDEAKEQRHGKTGKAGGEAVRFLTPLAFAETAMSIGHDGILPRNAREREALMVTSASVQERAAACRAAA
jgi:hypothetical protein